MSARLRWWAQYVTAVAFVLGLSLTFVLIDAAPAGRFR